MKPLSCRDRLEQALSRIADPKGEGARACLTVYADTARAAADAADARAAQRRIARRRSTAPSSASRICSTSPASRPAPARKSSPRRRRPAHADAAVVRRLRAAGAVIVAKTNMTEFALRRDRRQSAFRHAGQSARSRARAWRLVGGRRGRRRRRHVRDRDRQRYRRFGAHSGGAVRHRRFQAEPPAHPDRRALFH